MTDRASRRVSPARNEFASPSSTTVLRSAGYLTRLASNAVDALAIVEGSDPIDVLLTDMMMPEMNGDELARRLRQKYPALKVLYYTGYGDRLFDDKGRMWEDEAFLEKPCGPKALLEAVTLLRNRNRRIGDVSLERPGDADIRRREGTE